MFLSDCHTVPAFVTWSIFYAVKNYFSFQEIQLFSAKEDIDNLNRATSRLNRGNKLKINIMLKCTDRKHSIWLHKNIYCKTTETEADKKIPEQTTNVLSKKKYFTISLHTNPFDRNDIRSSQLKGYYGDYKEQPWLFVLHILSDPWHILILLWLTSILAHEKYNCKLLSLNTCIMSIKPFKSWSFVGTRSLY